MQQCRLSLSYCTLSFLVLIYLITGKWKSLSRVGLCNPMDYTVHGILQVRILEWVAFPFSRGSPQPRDWTQEDCLPAEPQGKHLFILLLEVCTFWPPSFNPLPPSTPCLWQPHIWSPFLWVCFSGLIEVHHHFGSWYMQHSDLVFLYISE